MLKLNNKSKGDTIIEVLFATSIFSLVAIGGLSIMNKGTAITQRALEITLVRQQIDAQAETLRFLNTSYIAAYKLGVDILGYSAGSSYPSGSAADWWALLSKYASEKKANGVTEVSPTLGSGACPTRQDIVSNYGFVLNTKKIRMVKITSDDDFKYPESYSQIRFDSSNNFIWTDGLWIEAIKSDGLGDYQSKIGYIDFYINACWSSVGQEVPMTLGTIVRLYEPR